MQIICLTCKNSFESNDELDLEGGWCLSCKEVRMSRAKEINMKVSTENPPSILDTLPFIEGTGIIDAKKLMGM